MQFGNISPYPRAKNLAQKQTNQRNNAMQHYHMSQYTHIPRCPHCGGRYTKKSMLSYGRLAPDKIWPLIRFEP